MLFRPSDIHKLKVKGVVLVTASLSLLSVAFGDYLAAAPTMLSVGTGSAGFVKFESEYQTEVANLKNDPLYLLGKLNKGQKEIKLPGYKPQYKKHQLSFGSSIKKRSALSFCTFCSNPSLSPSPGRWQTLIQQ